MKLSDEINARKREYHARQQREREARAKGEAKALARRTLQLAILGATPLR